MSLAVVFSLGSCSQEDLADVKQEKGVKLGIESTSIMQSRGVVETAYLPDGAEMGVFLKESSKNTYDNNTYANIKYTATGTTSQTWSSDAAPELSNTSGNVYAYYPYAQDAGTDITAIPVDLSTGDVDFMYSTAPASVNYSNPNASLTMKHLCALLRITFKRGTYEGNCNLTDIKAESVSYAKGTFNLLTNEFTPEKDNYDDVVEVDIKRTNLNKSFKTTDVTIDFLVHPSCGFPLIFFGFDGSSYDAYGAIYPDDDSFMSLTFEAGKIYTIEVTIDRTAIRTGVGQVSVETWTNSGYTGEYTETI